jgi:hypothetical protein
LSKRIYIVIPRTIDSPDPPFKVCMSCGRMAAHASHAAGMLGRKGVPVDDLDLIVLSVGSSEELNSVIEKLKESSVDFVEYRDDDHSFFGTLLTAIALFPIEKGSCQVLNLLKPWRCKCNEV